MREVNGRRSRQARSFAAVSLDERSTIPTPQLLGSTQTFSSTFHRRKTNSNVIVHCRENSLVKKWSYLAFTNKIGADGAVSKVGVGEPSQVRVLPPLIPSPLYNHLLLLRSHGSGSPCLPAQNSGRCRPSLRPHLMAPGGKDLQTHIPLKPAAGWSR